MTEESWHIHNMAGLAIKLHGKIWQVAIFQCGIGDGNRERRAFLFKNGNQRGCRVSIGKSIKRGRVKSEWAACR